MMKFKIGKDVLNYKGAYPVAIYMDFDTNKVSLKETTGAYKVTELIRPCTEDEIKDAVIRWLYM